MNTMRYLCSLFGASTDDLVTAETPAGSLFDLIFDADQEREISALPTVP